VPGLATKVLPDGERAGVGKRCKLFGVAAAPATGEEASGKALPDGDRVGAGVPSQPGAADLVENRDGVGTVASDGTVSERARRRAGPAFGASSGALAVAFEELPAPRPAREPRVERFCSGAGCGYPATWLDRTRRGGIATWPLEGASSLFGVRSPGPGPSAMRCARLVTDVPFRREPVVAPKGSREVPRKLAALGRCEEADVDSMPRGSMNVRLSLRTLPEPQVLAATVAA